MYRLHWYCWAS